MADFVSAMEIHTERANPIYKEHPDKIPNIFRDLSPITGAIKAVNLLLESPLYEVFILSTAPWNNPSAWTDKRLWLEDKFGDSINRRLILTHRKDLVKGDILIDDRPNNGAKDFEGEWIHFGTENFPDWSSVIKHLL
ncbi:hypothetical protein N9545_09200 [Salibacteraceae bacterium]|nr:hypothetical protein [Salibacteraceae bacterium]MDC1305175.1 hypothetical protein [Salibacteraceae bacterium]